jgi:hypothetical protein
MKVCMYVCMSGGLPPDLHNLSPQNLAWAPHFTRARHQAKGVTRNVDPRPCPQPRPLLLLSSLDHSARDYFTIVLWNSPGQHRVAHACFAYKMTQLIIKTFEKCKQMQRRKENIWANNLTWWLKTWTHLKFQQGWWECLFSNNYQLIKLVPFSFKNNWTKQLKCETYQRRHCLRFDLFQVWTHFSEELLSQKLRQIEYLINKIFKKKIDREKKKKIIFGCQTRKISR